MMKLVYSLLGMPGSPMSVKIEGTELVADLKKMIKEANEDITCTAHQLQLYSTQTSENWLSDPLEENDATINEALSREQLDENFAIKEVFENAPRKDTIHVLVVVPPLVRVKRPAEVVYEATYKRVRNGAAWIKAPTLPRLDFLGKMVRLSSEFLDGSDLQVPLGQEALVLFRRNAVEQLWGEIQRSVINLRALLLIHGPNGCGKSVASYAFAAGLVDVSMWNVLWIRYVQDDVLYRLVRFQEGKKLTCRILKSDMDQELQAILESLDSPMRKSIVFLDSCLVKAMEPIYLRCLVWKVRGAERRGLVVLTSPETAHDLFRREDANYVAYDRPRLRLAVEKVVRPPTACSTRDSSSESSSYLMSWTESDECDHVDDHMWFQLFSWTLEEYEEAVKDTTFFWSVASALGLEVRTEEQAAVTSLEARESAVRKKHYAAGGNARYMFVCSIDTVIQAIEIAVLLAKDVSNLVRAILYMQPLDEFGNQLRATYARGCSCVVSALAAKMIAARTTPDEIVSFKKAVDPSIGGQLFLCWFLALMRTNGTSFVLQEDPNLAFNWGPTVLSFINPKELASDYFGSCVYGWFVPTDRNQDGFDVMRLDTYEREEWDEEMQTTKLVTRARVYFLVLASHDCIAEPFVDMLNRLKVVFTGLGLIEVWFVVPRSKLDAFHPRKNEQWFETEVLKASFQDTLTRHTVDEAQQGIRIRPDSFEFRIRSVGVPYPVNVRS